MEHKPSDDIIISLMSSMSSVKALMTLIHSNQKVIMSHLFDLDLQKLTEDQRKILDELTKEQLIVDWNALSAASGMDLPIDDEFIDKSARDLNDRIV